MLLARISLGLAISTTLATAHSQGAYPPLPLPPGVTSSYIDTTNTTGLVFHYLSAGCDPSNTKPLLLILHGFPEIAWGFRDMLMPLAEQGYCVVAPDQRGYGRTTGWDTRSWAYTDLAQWEFENLVRDLVCFVYALGYKQVKSVMGHDFGTIPAGWAGLTRPDLFESVVLMSVPFNLPRQPPFALPSLTHQPSSSELSFATWPYADLEYGLEHLDPPRKSYQWFNSESNAAHDYLTAPTLGGLPAYFRWNWYLKSYDYLRSFTQAHELAGPSAAALAVLPLYYIMLANETLTENVATLARGQDPSASKAWFPDADAAVYAAEFERTGFQGALNYYRVYTARPGMVSDVGLLYAGRPITVPTYFVGGAWDWNTWMSYGAYDKINITSSKSAGGVLLNQSGHWTYLEQPEQTVFYIKEFLATLS